MEIIANPNLGRLAAVGTRHLPLTAPATCLQAHRQYQGNHSFLCQLNVRGTRAGRKLAIVHGAPPKWALTKPVDSGESPFRDLELMELWDGVGKTRVRQHVNPLRLDFQRPTPAPDWPAVFAHPSLPLALDIGSGYGRFLMLLQRNNSDQAVNYLGIEIRKPIVERSNAWAERLGLKGRLHYVFSNATISLRTLLQGYPGPITDVFIQFPDPHFKRRHHKRRVVQPQLVWALRDLMPPGGRLLLQSDVEEVAVAMRNMFEKYAGDAFELAPQHRECAVFFSDPPRLTGQEAADEPSLADAPAASRASAVAARELSHATTHAASSSHAAVGLGTNLASQAAGASPGDAGMREHESPAAEAAAQPAVAATRGGDHHLSAAQKTDVAASRSIAHASPSQGDNDAALGGSSGTDCESSEDDGDGGGSFSGSGAGSDSDADADIADMVSEWALGGWLVDNPVGTPTEREHYVAQQGLPVFRVALVRRR